LKLISFNKKPNLSTSTSKRQAWRKAKRAELQKREQQLGYAQQALSQELQERGKEMDSLVSGVKSKLR
jgi:outer membrane protein